jgi:hypothetical protein
VDDDAAVEALKRRVMTDLIWRDSVELWEVPELAAQQVGQSEPPVKPGDVRLADRALRELHGDGLIFLERASPFGRVSDSEQALTRGEVERRLEAREQVRFDTQTLPDEEIDANLSEWLSASRDRAASWFFVRPSRR